jgi:hypothetical protein
VWKGIRNFKEKVGRSIIPESDIGYLPYTKLNNGMEEKKAKAMK